MKIEVGEYIRTKQGTIGKTIEKYEKYCVIANTRGEIDVPYENIVNHSKNIIDLIETGDYVNGGYVLLVNNLSKTIGTTRNIYFDDEMKTIVTKEQFKNMEYRV